MIDKSMRMPAAQICLHYDLCHKIKNRKTNEGHVGARTDRDNFRVGCYTLLTNNNSVNEF